MLVFFRQAGRGPWWLLAFLPVLLLAAGCTVMLDPGALPADGPAAADPDAAVVRDAFYFNAQLGRSMNLGNALEGPYEGAWGVYLRPEFFEDVAAAGFDAVRVPIRWSAHADASPPFAIGDRFFSRIDWVIEQATANDLTAVINIHHFNEMMVDPDGYTVQFLALWEQIATRYQDAPDSIYFELLNEPNDKLDAAKWNEIWPQALAVVRATNPTRTVIVGPQLWNGITHLPTLELPVGDPNLIVTYHYYNPFEFTHQAAEWVPGSAAWAGTTWSGTPAQRAAVDREFDAAATWAAEHNVPLFMGEFGAYSAADADSRAAWTAYVARAAEERGFSWAYWELASGFGIYVSATRSWDEPLLNALIPAE